MENNVRYSAAFALLLTCASPSYAIEKWHAGVIGAGVTAAAILAIEHVLIPYINDLSQNSLQQKRAAELAHKQEQIQEIKQRQIKEPVSASSKYAGLLEAKQKLSKDMRTVQATYDQYKSSKLQNAEAFLKEVDECKHTLQQRDEALNQALARCISEDAYSYYSEELEALKSARGLDTETLERIITENHVRDPFRRHTYLNILDQYIARCRQNNVPTLVLNSLEVLRKQASRLLEPKIMQEMREREEADRRAQAFEAKIATERSAKEYIDSAKQDVAQSRAMTEESRKQNERFASLMQQQSADNARAIANCSTSVQQAATSLVQANQQQQELLHHVNQLEQALREQSAQIQNMVHAELAQLMNWLRQHGQFQNHQGNNGPAAPPFDA